jgi:hypothetical protein
LHNEHPAYRRKYAEDDPDSGHSRPVLARKNMTRNGDLWFLPMPGFVKIAHSLYALQKGT